MDAHLAPGRRLFAANLRRREDRIDLALAALLVAREEYPRLVIEDYLERLDQLAAGLAVEVDLESGIEPLARSIAGYLAQEQGFEGNGEDYYDPRNSYLNEVMDRRLGIPITLSLLYLEVARRVNVHLLPVPMPGHFLLKLQDGHDEAFLDAFNRGTVLDAAGARRLFERLHQGRIEFSESMLAAGTRRQLVTRMLTNLKAIHVQAGDDHRALRMVELLALVSPWDLDQVRDRGLLRLRLGRLEEAVPDLQAYAQYGPPGPAVETVRDALRRLAS